MAGKGKKAVSKIFNIGINISKWAKYLSNPIVWYALLFILLFLFLMGVISVFTVLPGAVTGFFSELVNKLIVVKENETTYNVKDEDILNLAKYLEEMGYDIENYGFVEKKEDVIRQSNTEDGEYYIDNKPSKGEITSIKSKYLEAYLGEEAKMFRIASKNYEYENFFEEYYLNKAINNTISEANENLRTFYIYYILGRDITKYDTATQTKYYAGKAESEQKEMLDVLEKIKTEYNKFITGNKDRRIGARNVSIRRGSSR